MCSRDVRPIPRASRTASRDPDTRHSMLMKFNVSFYRKRENYFEENKPQLYIFRRDFFIDIFFLMILLIFFFFFAKS